MTRSPRLFTLIFTLISNPSPNPKPGALEGLTRALALELGPRLRVNCLSPGFCDTERFDAMPPERKAAMLISSTSLAL